MQIETRIVYRSAEAESANYLTEVEQERLANMAWLVLVNQATQQEVPHIPLASRPLYGED